MCLCSPSWSMWPGEQSADVPLQPLMEHVARGTVCGCASAAPHGACGPGNSLWMCLCSPSWSMWPGEQSVDVPLQPLMEHVARGTVCGCASAAPHGACGPGNSLWMCLCSPSWSMWPGEQSVDVPLQPLMEHVARGTVSGCASAAPHGACGPGNSLWMCLCSPSWSMWPGEQSVDVPLQPLMEHVARGTVCGCASAAPHGACGPGNSLWMCLCSPSWSMWPGEQSVDVPLQPLMEHVARGTVCGCASAAPHGACGPGNSQRSITI
uniref:Uncharacterized protein n=1 Tax=Knipowitschia caucasica TaxID=637954 RepID=A0AAV2JSQ8_KNICA